MELNKLSRSINSFLKTRYKLLLCVIALISLIVPFLSTPFLVFSNGVYCDTLAYLHQALGYEMHTHSDFWYFNDRLSAFIPSFVIHSIFDFKTARYFIYGFQFLILFSLYFKIFRFNFSKETAIYLVSLWSCSSIVTGALSTEYTASKAEIYCLLSFLFNLKWVEKRNSNFLFFSCFFYALAIFANIKIVLYSTFIPMISFIYIYKNEKKLLNLGIMALGYLGGTLSLAIIGYTLGYEILFFWDTLTNLNADIAYSFDRFSFTLKSFERNSCFILFLGISFYFLKFKNLSLEFKVILISAIFVPLIYQFMDGSILIYSSINWLFLPLLMLVGSSLEKINLRIDLSFFGFFLIGLYLSSMPEQNNFRILSDVFNSSNLILGCVFIISCIWILTIYRYAFVPTLFILIGLIKPFGVYSEYLYSSEKNYQFEKKLVQTVEDFYTKYGKGKIAFVFHQNKHKYIIEKSEAYGVANLYEGCQDSKTFHSIEKYVSANWLKEDYVLFDKNYLKKPDIYRNLKDSKKIQYLNEDNLFYYFKVFKKSK